MTIECKGLCIELKKEKQRYGNGIKFCRRCNVFLNWHKNWCPCCHGLMRNSPRNVRKND